MTVRIGITGGIGSGKSYVCQLLRQHFQIPIYDCDTEAKRLNVEHPLIRQGLIDLLGPDVYLTDGQLNRPFLSQYLFADPSHVQTINQLIHPHVFNDFEQWVQRQQAPLVGTESAILFESGMYKLVDYTLIVTAPLQTRLERVKQRDHATEAQVLNRMKMQQDYESQLPSSHFVIQNDGSTPLLPQLEQLMEKLIPETT